MENNKRKFEDVLDTKVGGFNSEKKIKTEDKEIKIEDKETKIEYKEIIENDLQNNDLIKENNKKICKFFNTKKGCNKKDCEYLHEKFKNKEKDNKEKIDKKPEKIEFKDINDFEKKYNLKVISNKETEIKKKKLIDESYLILINKEKGITSYDVIRKYKNILNSQNLKCGHSGTVLFF
jgi:hypothetical protein